MASQDPFDSALDLLRRLDPKHTTTHLNNIISLAPDLTEDLLSSVDQPLTIKRCRQTGRDYLLCDYNRDGDSYRSPWSNRFDPPSMRVDPAAELYYEGGVSSVYFWNLDDGFAGVVLLKKGALLSLPTIYNIPSLGGRVCETLASLWRRYLQGVWDSIHVFEAIERGRTTHYKLTSTVILHLSTASGGASSDMDLSGNMTRQVEQELPVESDDSHIANVGRLVEDMELKMRNLLQEVYFGKAKDVVADLRSLGSLSEGAKDREAQKEIIGSMRR
ncbi:unnamed protein product [Parascedosporium putredinis]|uniref:F-actin-capping protein subunit beta n=1 Tax=Parascedosporium putredinis TaxID=1442378 RepID=A0A9P1H6M8_9PEZI|nr:unnamed protein product [Parascedosporium putredinis]CAI7998960.1 unnamed protein product [Parascedosporium putredinis]